MKRIWSALICFLLALSLCVFEIFYTSKSVSELSEILIRAQAVYAEDENAEETEELLECAAKLWESRESVMNMFLYHDKVDDLGALIKRSKALVARKSGEADAEMLEAVETLEMIKRAELPTLDNIL